MNKSLKTLLVLVLSTLTICASTMATAEAQDEGTAPPLKVAVAECPPFVIFDNGEYTGLAVLLWEKVGAELRKMMPWIEANKIIDKSKN